MNDTGLQPHVTEEDRPDQEPLPDSAVVRIPGTRVRLRGGRLWGRTLAFSFDDTSIQMAAVGNRAGKAQILHVEKIYLPAGGLSLDGPSQAAASAIDAWVRKYGGRRPRIMLAVAGEQTAYRVFLMPVLKRKDLDSAISFELGRQVPFPIHDCYSDYRTVFRTGAKDQQRYRIALAAATRRFIHEQLAPFRSLNLEVAHVYLAQDVVGQLLNLLPNYSDEQHYTLVHIKRSRSEISFYRGSSLELFNIVSTGSSMLEGDGGQTRFEYFAESLASELQTSLDYYTGQYSRNYTSDIFVYGDLSYGDGLVSLLNGRTPFTFQNFPTDRLGLSVSRHGAFEDILPVCLPALAAACCRERLSNLLPTDDQARQSRAKFAAAARVALVSLTLLLTTYWGLAKLENDHAALRLSQLQGQVQGIGNSAAYSAYNTLKRQVMADRRYLETARSQPSHLHLALKDLSHMTPTAINLFSLDYNNAAHNGELILQGVVSGSDIPPEVTLAEYAVTLASSPFFGDVSVVRHVKRADGDQFEIEFTIKMKEVI